MKVLVAIVASGVVLCAAMISADGQAPAKAPVPTYTKDVAPILFKNCTGCHRPGDIAPMSLLTYDDVRPRAKDIRDKVADGVMPPWHVARVRRDRGDGVRDRGNAGPLAVTASSELNQRQPPQDQTGGR